MSKQVDYAAVAAGSFGVWWDGDCPKVLSFDEAYEREAYLDYDYPTENDMRSPQRAVHNEIDRLQFQLLNHVEQAVRLTNKIKRLHQMLRFNQCDPVPEEDDDDKDSESV